MNDLSAGLFVGLYVCLSSALWKNGKSDPDAIWRRRSDRSRLRQVVGFGDRSTGRGKFGAHHCNQLGLYGIHVQQSRDAALFPNYFGQTCLLTFL